MLKRAYMFKGELNRLFLEGMDKEHNKYYYENWNRFEEDISDDDWNELHFVSVSDDKILGSIKCSLDRPNTKAYRFAVINFTETLSITFSRDVVRFLDMLFERYNFRKITWDVLKGNPAEKIYDKLINNYGGTIVGINKLERYNAFGELCDVKHYELFKENYLKNRNK